MEKQTESDRIFKFDENRKLYAIDYERNIYKGTLEEAIELSQTELFQIKRCPETEKYFGGSDAAFVLFGKGDSLAPLGKQDVTQNLFLLENQRITDMNKYDVLANLREFTNLYYGIDRSEDDIYEAFGTFAENGSETNSDIVIEKGQGHDIIASIDVEDATRFVIKIDAEGIIKDVVIE